MFGRFLALAHCPATLRCTLVAGTVCLAAVTAVGCHPSTSPTPGPASPFSPGGTGASQIDVQAHEARPKLAIIRREGDPSPALVIAVAAGRGAAAHAALAGMLERRLADAGGDVEVHSDGIGVRAVFTPSADTLGPMLSAWVKATRDAVMAADVVAANQRVTRLGRAPLASAVLAPLAGCSGEAAAPAKDLGPIQSAELDKLRQSALVMERTAVAVVGDADTGQVANDAMEDTEGWLRGTALAPSRQPEEHGAYFSADLAPAAARLHVAVHVSDPVQAVGAVHRLRLGPPLSSKLDALPSPWRVASLAAVALPRGGCIRVALEPHGDGGTVTLMDTMASAARAVAAVRREVSLQAAIATDPFLVTREIIGGGRAHQAAARAAWWALSNRGDGPNALFSALEVGSGGKEPLLGADGKPMEESSLHAMYVQRASRITEPPAQIAARRKRTEKGQGQLWMMLGSACPVRHEGQWDAGMLAVAATAAAAQSPDPTVSIEPWVSADGVGIVAHSAQLEVGESAGEHARRVARALVQAYGAVPHDANAFARAKRVALGHTGSALGTAFFTLARNVLPDHPSWIAPWGNDQRIAAATLVEVAGTWRDVLHAPARLAVINNRDDSQAAIAAEVVDHWLLPEATARSCAELPTRDQPQTGESSVTASEPAVMVAVPYLGPAERPLAELTAAVLSSPADPLQAGGEPWEVRVVGGLFGGALLLSRSVAGEALEAARVQATTRLEHLARKGPEDAEVTAAQLRLTRKRMRDQAHPRARLVDLWLDRSATEAAEPEAWRQWLAKRAGEKRLVVVTAK